MSEFQSPAVRTRGDVLAGYTIAAPSWLVHCEIEEELHRRHVALLVGGAMRASPDLLGAALEQAGEIVERRPFAALTERYFDLIFTDKSLTPYLLWQTLRRHHPAIAQDTAANLVTDQNLWQVREAVLYVFGWNLSKKDTGGAGEPEPTENLSISPPSPVSSEAGA